MDKTPTQLLRPLLLHANWELMEEYLAGEKARLVTQLCKCDADQLKGLQGELKALEQLSQLKLKLNTEMRSKR